MWLCGQWQSKFQSNKKNQIKKKIFGQKLTLISLFREDSVIHDSFTCQIPSNADVRSWPTQRLENEPNYVGTSGDQITVAKVGQCPEKCRPQYHEDWTLC